MGYLHLDTGAMYRAVTLACHRQNLPPENSKQLTALLAQIDIRFVRESAGEQKVLLNGEDVSQAIREPEINRRVSAYSALPEVRRRLVKLQQQAAQDHDVVCEGRDIGTRVFPDAPHKFFIVADLEVRAKRRQLELADKGHTAELDALKNEIARRDKEDQEREHSPLIQAADAVLLDTSELTIEEQVNEMLAHIVGPSN